jgi:hypothetical protein
MMDKMVMTEQQVLEVQQALQDLLAQRVQQVILVQQAQLEQQVQ